MHKSQDKLALLTCLLFKAVFQVIYTKKFVLIIILNKKKNTLLSQEFSAQARYSEEIPTQGLPPYWGSMHFLDLISWPPPQVALQADHSDQSDQTPSTGI